MTQTDTPLATQHTPWQWFNQPWDERLPFVLEMVREVSAQREPEAMVQAYGLRMRQILHSHRSISLSRRGLEAPCVRITRSDVFDRYLDPWKERDQLPIVSGGLLSELIYGEQPVIINDLQLDPADPAYPYLAGIRSITAIPLFEDGQAMNMVVIGRSDADAYDRAFLPEHVWLSNLFGRATANLVLRRDLEAAYGKIEGELGVVAEIQRSLLPERLPQVPQLDIAAHYRTSRHAGGDYYDFFELPGGKLGILIADVSGHGTPAAVIMAVTHAIAHSHDACPESPSAFLTHLNRHLAARYTRDTGTFVTAFYGVFDPATQVLTFANAGHNPPRLTRGCGGPNGIIEGEASLPLGIDADETFADSRQTLHAGYTLIFYTDGITEARNPAGQMFDTERLDAVLNSNCGASAQVLVDQTIAAVEQFTGGTPPHDDRTMVVLQISGCC